MEFLEENATKTLVLLWKVGVLVVYLYFVNFDDGVVGEVLPASEMI